MCKCTPSLRTPWCGKGDCKQPENQYYSTHQELQDMAKEQIKKIVNVDKEYDLQDVRNALKYILDKLSTMDLYMRGSNYRYQGKVVDGEVYRKTVIKEFLQDMKAGKYTEKDIKLLSLG